MSWVIDYLPELGVLRIKTSGTMDLEQLTQMAHEGLAAGLARGATSFLVDHRDMTTALSTEDVFDLPRLNAEMGIGKTMRVAIVYSTDSPSRDDFFFYDVRNLSKGVRNIRLFTDLQHAIDWLAEERQAAL
jgi:hypothetical protein